MSERHIPAELRRLVADRGQHCCEYCRTQARYSAGSFTVDHIIPRSLGRSTTADNLALCCHGCNQHKSRRTDFADPVTATLVRLFHPGEQRWEAHFAWNDDFTHMLALTPTGRATIAALQLTRPGLVKRIRAQAWRARTLSALGAFAESWRHGEQALRLATLEGRGVIPIVVYACLGYLYLAQGDLEQAIWRFDQGLALCRASGSRDWLRPIAVGLDYAYALRGRLAEGRALLEEGISESICTGGLP